MLHLLVLLSTFLQQTGGLLESVDSERGGRHWIEQQPPAAKSPEESLACFQIEPGSHIELVAAEPLVFDPVWIDFDHRGRLFAAEYGDYPIGPVKPDGTEDTAAKSLSKIVLLEDEDGDGRMDKRTVFADNLTFCHSFMPLMDGILACAQTEILFLKDTDGDNVADVREVWFDGFTPAHPQMQIGCPRWGLDNWIYLTYAPGNVRCRRFGYETEEPVKMPRQDMRFDPFTMKFEPISGLGQFGNTINNDGVRFFSTNRNPIMMEMIPQSIVGRNPYQSIGKRHADVGPSGGDTKVFPLIDMKSNWLAHAGTHTSACGVTAYRGDLWDTDFQNSVFVCEPIGHLVTRSIIRHQEDTPVLTAERAQPKADFLASTDEWFRPSSLRTGPSGALYVADMYRMWVEHPKFLPPEIAAQIDWRAGEDRGRIWRIVPAEAADVEKFVAPESDPKKIEEWIKHLESSNGWRRFTAQQQIAEWTVNPEMQSESLVKWPAETEQRMIAALNQKLISNEYSDKQALNMLGALEVLGGLKEAALEHLCESAELPGLKVQLARLIAPWSTPSSSLREKASELANDKNAFVRHFSTVNLVPKTYQTLSSLFRVDHKIWSDPWYQTAVYSLYGDDATLLCALPILKTTNPKLEIDVSQLMQNASQQVAQQGEPASLTQFVDLLVMAKPNDFVPMAIGFQQGAKRNTGTLAYKSLPQMFAAIETLRGIKNTHPDSVTKVRNKMAKIVDVSGDANASPAERLTSLRLLSIMDAKRFLTQVPDFLLPAYPADVQDEVIQIVRQLRAIEAYPVIMNHLQQLGPGPRRSAIELLLGDVASTTELLTKMKAEQLSPAMADIDQRLRLLQNRDPAIKALAEDVFGGAISANRKEVADTYQAALTMEASLERGAAVYKKTCSKCHKINGEGHNVGPDISDTRNRSREALLYDILDPNRRVDPQFSEYVVVTIQGRTYNGLLVSDTDNAVVLRQPEGKETTIARTDIQELQATNKSLMPEGIEKDVTVQQMADLLAFLKQR